MTGLAVRETVTLAGRPERVRLARSRPAIASSLAQSGRLPMREMRPSPRSVACRMRCHRGRPCAASCVLPEACCRAIGPARRNGYPEGLAGT